MKKTTKKAAPKKAGPARMEGRPVVVTTAHRGVFFGYAKETASKTIKLTRARNILYWAPETKGFVGLAVTGPSRNARVGPAADMLLHDVTCVVECEPVAVKAWEAAPWQK